MITVYKVVATDELSGELVSCIVDGKHRQTYYTDRPTICPNMFVFASIKQAQAFRFEPQEIWEAETPETRTPPALIVDFLYLNYHNYYERFWSGERLNRAVLDHTPRGTLLCDELTLLREVSDAQVNDQGVMQ